MHISRARAFKVTRTAYAKVLSWDSTWPGGQCNWKGDERENSERLAGWQLGHLAGSSESLPYSK